MRDLKRFFIPLFWILLIGGGVLSFFFSQQAFHRATTNTHHDLTQQMIHEKDPIEIRITASGFVPSAVVIHQGDVIVFRNADGRTHIIASGPHPTHTVHDALNIGEITGIDTRSIILTKPGTYSYHDHINPKMTGTITVQ